MVTAEEGSGVEAADSTEVGKTEDCSEVEATGTEEGPGDGAADRPEVGETEESSVVSSAEGLEVGEAEECSVGGCTVGSADDKEVDKTGEGTRVRCAEGSAVVEVAGMGVGETEESSKVGCTECSVVDVTDDGNKDVIVEFCEDGFDAVASDDGCVDGLSRIGLSKGLLTENDDGACETSVGCTVVIIELPGD